jgi:hypothetical protein
MPYICTYQVKNFAQIASNFNRKGQCYEYYFRGFAPIFNRKKVFLKKSTFNDHSVLPEYIVVNLGKNRHFSGENIFKMTTMTSGAESSNPSNWFRQSNRRRASQPKNPFHGIKVSTSGKGRSDFRHRFKPLEKGITVMIWRKKELQKCFDGKRYYSNVFMEKGIHYSNVSLGKGFHNNVLMDKRFYIQ